MKQTFEIPKMNIKDIAKWYKNIKPIANDQERPKYLRKLTKHELTHTAYTWLYKPSDYAEPVDYSKLSVLADIKMLHSYSFQGFFKPDVGEVIRQIPKEYLEKVIAFEIIKGAIGYNTVYNEELNAGFHVSIVRLYQAKDDTNEAAQPIVIYPTTNDKVPIGMTKEDFNSLFG